MQLALVIAADTALSQQTPEQPAPPLETKAGIFNRLCARSRGPQACATSQADALGQLPVLSSDDVDITVLSQVVRPARADGTCALAGAPHFLCVPVPAGAAATACRCASRTYYPTDGAEVLARRREYRAVMFYQVAAKRSLAQNQGPGEVLETGFLDIMYNSSDLSSYSGLCIVYMRVAAAGLHICASLPLACICARRCRWLYHRSDLCIVHDVQVQQLRLELLLGVR